MSSKLCIFFGLATVFVRHCAAEILNDIDLPDRNSLPKPVSYFTFPPSEENSASSEKPLSHRFAYPAGSGLEGYGPNVLSTGFYPLKFDVGGLLVGAIFGLGALLIVPKLIHLLVPELAAYGQAYGVGSPYGRNVDVLPEGLDQITSQFEKVLSENNINSSECMQKAICTYVQSTYRPTRRNRAENLDNVSENSISDNLISFLIDGSKFKTALENGKQSTDCNVLYPRCPFTQDSVTNGIRQLLLHNTTFSETESNDE